MPGCRLRGCAFAKKEIRYSYQSAAERNKPGSLPRRHEKGNSRAAGNFSGDSE
nr:MAG TPA: hypothetical protein [Caudoviricetes sp.]